MDNRRVMRDTILLTCPYDPVHRVEKGTRFQRHLVECRKNHPNIEDLVCPFNQTHRVKAPEYSYHLENCPDNNLHREFVEVKKNYDLGFKENLPTEQPIDIPDSENWDNEMLSTPFEIPSISTNKNVKFVDPSLLSHMKPRHKKKFRKNLLKGTIKLSTDDSDNEDQEREEQQPQPRQSHVDAVNTEPIQSKVENMRISAVNVKSAVISQRPLTAGGPVQRPLTASTPFFGGVGRGLFPCNQNRIAANIFSQDKFTPSAMNSSVGRMQCIGIGRGRPVGFQTGKNAASELKDNSDSINFSDADEDSDDDKDVNVSVSATSKNGF